MDLLASVEHAAPISSRDGAWLQATSVKLTAITPNRFKILMCIEEAPYSGMSETPTHAADGATAGRTKKTCQFADMLPLLMPTLSAGAR